MKRTIFHIDVNAAFLSWEAVYRLRHKGAGYQGLATKNIKIRIMLPGTKRRNIY